jgi:WD40 repeat protein
MQIAVNDLRVGLPEYCKVQHMAFLPGTNVLLVCSDCGLLELNCSKSPSGRILNKEWPLGPIVVSPNGNMLTVLDTYSRDSICIYDILDMTIFRRLVVPHYAIIKRIIHGGTSAAQLDYVTFTPSNECVIGLSEASGSIYCWEIDSGKLRYRFEKSENSLMSYTLCHDGSMVIGTKTSTSPIYRGLENAGRHLELFNSETGVRLSVIPDVGVQQAYAYRLNESRLLLNGGTVLDLTTRLAEQVFPLNRHIYKEECLFMPMIFDGKGMVTVSPGDGLRILCTASGDILYSNASLTARSVAVSSNSKYIALKNAYSDSISICEVSCTC